MVKVAVAGGTGCIGLHIVEGLVQTGKHEVIVLSRRASHPVLDKLGVSTVPVSYDDPAALVKALEGVHTVISTIFGVGEGVITKPQLALLDAAIKAGKHRLVIDLHEVDFLDSVALATIVHARKELPEDGRLALAVEPGSYVMLIFESSGLNKMLDLAESREAAIAHVSS